MRPIALILLLSLFTPAPAATQWWGGADAGLGNYSPEDSRFRRGLELLGGAGWESGRLLMEASGVVAGERYGATGHLATRVPFGAWTVTLDGRALARRESQGHRWGRWDGEVALSYRHRHWGVWGGYRLSGASNSVDAAGVGPTESAPGDTAVSNPTLRGDELAVPPFNATVTAGTWRQAGPVLLTLSLSSDLVRVVESRSIGSGPVDTLPSLGTVETTNYRRAADVELGASWARGPLSLSLVLGGRLAHGSEGWGSLEGTLAVSRGMALVTRLGLRPADLRTGLPSQSFVFAGVRISTRPFRRAPPMPVLPAVLKFSIDTAQPGTVRVWAVAPHATSVEVMSDLTDWKSLSLDQVDADRWAAVLDREAGPHRIVIRVNGGRWSVPPGLPSLEDDFHGNVGLLIVP